MERDDISSKSDALCALLAEKLALKRGSLEQRLHRAGRRLPARIRDSAHAVARAEALSGNPRLARRIDQAQLTRAFDEVRDHLRGIDPAERRRGALLGMLGGLAFNTLLLIALTLAFLRWRGIA